MSEVRLPAPVKATPEPRLLEGSWEEGTSFKPGAFAFEKREGSASIWGYILFTCPCGCGSFSRLAVGMGKKPTSSPTWEWNGDREAPTLSPSIHHIGHWHGWLKAGYFTQA